MPYLIVCLTILDKELFTFYCIWCQARTGGFSSVGAGGIECLTDEQHLKKEAEQNRLVEPSGRFRLERSEQGVEQAAPLVDRKLGFGVRWRQAVPTSCDAPQCSPSAWTGGYQ